MNLYNSHDNITLRNEHQCWAIRNCFNFFLKVLIIRFLFLRGGGNLFHLIDDVEVHFFLSFHLMQWVISKGWCSLMELLLRKSLVFVLCFNLFRKLHKKHSVCVCVCI